MTDVEKTTDTGKPDIPPTDVPVISGQRAESKTHSTVDVQIMPIQSAAEIFVSDLQYMGQNVEIGMSDINSLRDVSVTIFKDDSSALEEFRTLLGKTHFTATESDRLKLLFIKNIYNEATLQKSATQFVEKGGSADECEEVNIKMRQLCEKWKVPFSDKAVVYNLFNGLANSGMYDNSEDPMVFLSISGIDKYNDSDYIKHTAVHETIHIYVQPIVNQYHLTDPEKETLVDFVLAKYARWKPEDHFRYPNPELDGFKKLLGSLTGNLSDIDLPDVIAKYKGVSQV